MMKQTYGLKRIPKNARSVKPQFKRTKDATTCNVVTVNTGSVGCAWLIGISTIMGKMATPIMFAPNSKKRRQPTRPS